MAGFTLPASIMETRSSRSRWFSVEISPLNFCPEPVADGIQRLRRSAGSRRSASLLAGSGGGCGGWSGDAGARTISEFEPLGAHVCGIGKFRRIDHAGPGDSLPLPAATVRTRAARSIAQVRSIWPTSASTRAVPPPRSAGRTPSDLGSTHLKTADPRVHVAMAPTKLMRSPRSV